jgi:error-prone DNA polymerase
MPEKVFHKIKPHPINSPPAAAVGGVAMVTHPYAELAVTSNFSFLRGASHPEELVEQAAALGYRAIAIADRNTLAGIVRAHVAARQHNVQIVIGCRLVLMEAIGTGAAVGPAGAASVELCVYPQDRDAYARLCTLLTLGKRRAPKGECYLTLDDVAAHARGLLALAMPPETFGTPHGDHAAWERAVLRLRDIFDDDRLSLAAVVRFGADDAVHLAALRSLSERSGVPLAAANDAHYHVPQRRPLQDVVTCIRHGCTIHEAGLRLAANAERHLKPGDEMARLFASMPGAIERSLEIARRAAGFSLDQIKYQYPLETCPPEMTPTQYLRKLAYEGAAERYGGRGSGGVAEWQSGTVAKARESGSSEPSLRESVAVPLRHSATLPLSVSNALEHELALIAELGYETYFLTCHDIVRFARSRGILCQGRGGAANSAVCYCLGITEVDPSRFKLLFERFISRARKEPPDIDIDFEHERREEVIQYIYAKYGRERAALTAEVISYRGRSAVRDVGKAMGLSEDCIDALAKNLDRWHEPPSEERVREIGLDPREPTIRRVIELAHELAGFPRHLSQHVGGFVITQAPLSELVPIENAAMEDRTVIEWDKDDIDAMGMLKVDVLGLGMLTCVRRCVELVNRVTPKWQSGGVAEWQSQQEETHGGQDVSRSGSVSARNGADASDLSCDAEHAKDGIVRIDITDAASGGVDPDEHCRGLRSAHASGAPPRSAFGDGVAVRGLDCVRTCNELVDARARAAPTRSDRRGGPNHLCADPLARRQDRSRTPCEAMNSSSTAPLCHYATLPLSTRSIPLDDPAVYDMICKADTVGVFQIESRAQMSMLPRLKPRTFYDLVIEVAIVRPGPIQGGMVHPYLRRREGKEPVTYPSPEVEGVLGRTLGVPLFQEQAMQLAIVAAGFTPDEADGLRKSMAAWKRKGSGIYQYGQKLMDGMIAKGYPREFAERCFEQIKGFSEYGFPESHAASFALIVYYSAWLKRYHPAAFAAALINSQPMGFYQPAQIVRDAQEHGVEVRGVDVNRSGWDCSLEAESDTVTQWQSGKVNTCGAMSDLDRDTAAPAPLCHSATATRVTPALRLGTRLVKGLAQNDADCVAAAVRQHGPFRDVESLWRASGVSVRGLRCLAQADAFGSMGLTRQQALWQIKPLRDERLPLFETGVCEEGWSQDQSRSPRRAQKIPSEDSVKQDGSGGDTGPSIASSSLRGESVLPVADAAALAALPPIAPSTLVRQDYEHVGLSLKAHPMSFLRERLASGGVVPCGELRDPRLCPQGRRLQVAGLVLVRQRPSTASGVVFFTLEDESGIANLIVWSDTFETYRRVARQSHVLQVRGKVERQGEVVHLHVDHMESLDHALPDVEVASRDFH